MAAHSFEGHEGINIIRPHDHDHPEYVVILRFDRYKNLRTWLESDVRKCWLEQAKPLTVAFQWCCSLNFVIPRVTRLFDRLSLASSQSSPVTSPNPLG